MALGLCLREGLRDPENTLVKMLACYRAGVGTASMFLATREIESIMSGFLRLVRNNIGAAALDGSGAGTISQCSKWRSKRLRKAVDIMHLYDRMVKQRGFEYTRCAGLGPMSWILTYSEKLPDLSTSYSMKTLGSPDRPKENSQPKLYLKILR